MSLTRSGTIHVSAESSHKVEQFSEPFQLAVFFLFSVTRPIKALVVEFVVRSRSNIKRQFEFFFNSLLEFLIFAVSGQSITLRGHEEVTDIGNLVWSFWDPALHRTTIVVATIMSFSCFTFPQHFYLIQKTASKANIKTDKSERTSQPAESWKIYFNSHDRYR